MMGGGRLGGSEELAKLPPREAAAAAAERRAQAASFAKRHLLLDDVSEESAPDLVGAGGPSVRAPSVTFTLGAPAAGRAGVGFASDARHEESSGAQRAAIAGTCPRRHQDSPTSAPGLDRAVDGKARGRPDGVQLSATASQVEGSGSRDEPRRNRPRPAFHGMVAPAPVLGQRTSVVDLTEDSDTEDEGAEASTASPPWSCDRCTFVNAPGLVRCEMCDAVKVRGGRLGGGRLPTAVHTARSSCIALD